MARQGPPSRRTRCRDRIGSPAPRPRRGPLRQSGQFLHRASALARRGFGRREGVAKRSASTSRRSRGAAAAPRIGGRQRTFRAPARRWARARRHASPAAAAVRPGWSEARAKTRRRARSTPGLQPTPAAALRAGRPLRPRRANRTPCGSSRGCALEPDTRRPAATGAAARSGRRRSEASAALGASRTIRVRVFPAARGSARERVAHASTAAPERQMTPAASRARGSAFFERAEPARPPSPSRAEQAAMGGPCERPQS